MGGKGRTSSVVLFIGVAVILLALLLEWFRSPSDRPVFNPTGASAHDATTNLKNDPTAGIEATPSVSTQDESRQQSPIGSVKRSIKKWQDLPPFLAIRPHWLVGVKHPTNSRGERTGWVALLGMLEDELAGEGFDRESIAFGINLVERVDQVLQEATPSSTPAAFLLEVSGSEEVIRLLGGNLPLQHPEGNVALKVRALALLAAYELTEQNIAEIGQLAMSHKNVTVRAAAAATLHWKGAERSLTAWFAQENSIEAVASFLEAARHGSPALHRHREFYLEPAVEAGALVSLLTQDARIANWPGSLQTNAIRVFSLYGRARKDVSDWMLHEYAKSGADDQIKCELLSAFPKMQDTIVFEQLALDAVDGPSKSASSAALHSLGHYSSPNAVRCLLHVAEAADVDRARSAITALIHNGSVLREECVSTLTRVAGNHPDADLRNLAAIAVQLVR